MHKNATKCNKTQSKWCLNKHGASKIIDMFETYHRALSLGGRTTPSSSWESATAMNMAMELMEMALGAIPHPGRVPEREFCPQNFSLMAELFVDGGLMI
jgi:hypothetical protein